MTENPGFLQYLIDEQLYLIDDPLDKMETNQKEEEAPIVKPTERVESSPQMEEPKEVYESKLIDSTLILFENAQSSDMVQGERAYLEKILGAVKLKWDDVVKQNVLIDPIEDKPQHARVVAFTANHGFGVLPPYQVSDQQGQQILMAHDLATISGSVEYRKQLWAALQKMFL